MAKFAIECPKCNSINTASTFIFAKKVIKCGTCGKEIDTRVSRMVSKKCTGCGCVFLYDQAKQKLDPKKWEAPKCPMCGETIEGKDMMKNAHRLSVVNCPQCSCNIEINADLKTEHCPICDCEFDVERELAKQKLVDDGGISVIKYEGDNSTFVWKHPIEDFNFGSQLLVHESQEAIFFFNGQALDVFGAGRYTLETENIPILKKAFNLPVGSQSPFHAEIYFVNRSVKLGMKWGTDTRIKFIDPITSVPLEIGAYGELELQVKNSKQLLIKLVGTTNELTANDLIGRGSSGTDRERFSKANLQGLFRAPLMTEIKSYLASTIKELRINVLEIDQHLSEMSQRLCERISPKFEEYGLTIPNFYISNIYIPEDHPNVGKIRELLSKESLGIREKTVDDKIRLMEAETSGHITRMNAAATADSEAYAIRQKGLAEAEVLRAKGIDGRDVLDAEVRKEFAASMGNIGGSGGGNGVISDAMGLMAGMKLAGYAVNAMDSTFTADPTENRNSGAQDNTWECECGHKGNRAKFCEICGKPKPEAWTCKCGAKNMRAFCAECGSPKPQEWTCCKCGHTGNRGNFCEICGAPKS